MGSGESAETADSKVQLETNNKAAKELGEWMFKTFDQTEGGLNAKREPSAIDPKLNPF